MVLDEKIMKPYKGKEVGGYIATLNEDEKKIVNRLARDHS